MSSTHTTNVYPSPRSFLQCTAAAVLVQTKVGSALSSRHLENHQEDHQGCQGCQDHLELLRPGPSQASSSQVPV